MDLMATALGTVNFTLKIDAVESEATISLRADSVKWLQAVIELPSQATTPFAGIVRAAVQWWTVFVEEVLFEEQGTTGDGLGAALSGGGKGLTAGLMNTTGKALSWVMQTYFRRLVKGKETPAVHAARWVLECCTGEVAEFVAEPYLQVVRSLIAQDPSGSLEALDCGPAFEAEAMVVAHITDFYESYLEQQADRIDAGKEPEQGADSKDCYEQLRKVDAIHHVKTVAQLVSLSPMAVIMTLLETLEPSRSATNPSGPGLLCRSRGQGDGDGDKFAFDPRMHELVGRCCVVMMVETLMLEPHTTELNAKDKKGRDRPGRDGKDKKEKKKAVATELGRSFRGFLRANKIRTKENVGDAGDAGFYEGSNPALSDPDTIVRWLLPFVQQSAAMARLNLSTLLRRDPNFWIHLIVWYQVSRHECIL